MNPHPSKCIVSLVLTLVVLARSHGDPLPAEGAWQTGLRSEPHKEGVDRIFLVNRGWIEGRVTKIDATTVTFAQTGQTHPFPRAEVSVMQLSDWLSPEKRPDKQELKVRVVCEGDSEVGTLLFTRGTIISKVDAAPKFTVGQDSDDKLGSDRTSIWFEKGPGDRTPTSFTTDLTLLVPTTDVLPCEILCARANGFSGPLSIRFLNPADGKELVSLRRPTKEFWNQMDVPLAKLKAGSPPSKIDCVASSEVITRNVQTMPPSPAPAISKDTNAARVLLFDSQPATGRVLSMDDYSVRMQVGFGQAVLIPRGKIAYIELNDWEVAYRGSKPADKEVSAPLTVSFAGPSAQCELTLPNTEAIAKLIAPPHLVSGWDRDDVGVVKSERAFGFEKTVVDRSPSQVEATVLLRVTNKQAAEFGVSNAYTNVWAGDLQVNIYEALTRKNIETSGATTQKSVNSSLKISRGRLLPQ